MVINTDYKLLICNSYVCLFIIKFVCFETNDFTYNSSWVESF